MAVKVLNDEEVRRRLQAGIDKLAGTVRVTLGPKGRNGVIAVQGRAPLVTSDGAALVKELELPDFVENMGAQIIREIALKTRETAGDGTTTAIVLAQAITDLSFRNISAGANPMVMKKGMQHATQLAGAAIRKLSNPVNTTETIIQVAALAARDQYLGELIAEAITQVGPEGVSVTESNTVETGLKIQPGMQIDRSFLLPQMADDPRRMVSELIEPYVLITDQRITDGHELVPLMEKLAPLGRPLLVVAEEISGEVLGLLMENKRRGILNTVAIHPPAYGEGRQDQLEDLALLTEGIFFSETTDHADLKAATSEMLGRAAYVRIDGRSTMIRVTGPGGEVAQRIRYLRMCHDRSQYEFDRQQLKARIARLGKGMALIEIGASSEVEMKEIRQRGEDGLNAAKAALEQGVVPGGGVAYLRCIPALQAYADTLSGDMRTGVLILIRALEAPARQIAENAGFSGAEVLSGIRSRPAGFGFDAMKGIYVNMMEHGIADPALVTARALQNASSAAQALITSQAGVIKIR